MSKFEEKIKPVLNYIGTIGAVLAAIMYIIVVFVLIFGFQAQSIVQSIVFAVVNAIIGLIIMFFLKLQGQSFAKNLPENQVVLKEYNEAKPKKKNQSMAHYWISSSIKDILFKGLSVAITTVGIIYIVITGSQDYNLLLLALANLILFACFGLLAMSSAYDFYNENHIPYLKDLIERRKNNDKDRRQDLQDTRGSSETESDRYRPSEQESQ